MAAYTFLRIGNQVWHGSMTDTAIYTHWARHYNLLHAFKDFRGEAERVSALLRQYQPGASSLLDVACGTGQHLRYLDPTLALTGLDANQALLDVLVEQLPDCRTHCALMQDFELREKFDVLTCLFSSIGFVQTLDGLSRTFHNFAAHLNPRGLVLIEPWFSPANFWVGKLGGHFVDLPDLKVAWIYNTLLEDGLSVLDNRFLVGTGEKTEQFHERHVLGLFSPEQYRAALDDAGFKLLEYLGPEQSWKRGLYVARRLGD